MKFSIITPSLNQCRFLKRTAESVLSQRGDFELEWIVMDGGSSDGTVEFLQSISDPRVKWRSEKDAGQAAAINVGFAQSTGEVLAWLNADDLYLPGALERVASAMAEKGGWVVGRCNIIDENDKEIRSWVTMYKNRQLDRYSYRRLLKENFISQPAVFSHRKMIEKEQILDPTLHYTMDYDLWLRLGKMRDPIVLDQTIASFRFHPSSKSGGVNREQFDEGFRVAQRYFDGDARSRFAHRFHVEKIVWTYRAMRLLGL